MYKHLLLTIGLLINPAIVIAQDTNGDFSHKFELISTDIGLPVIGDKLIDSIDGGHDFWFMSQFMYGGICTLYRTGELTGNSINDQRVISELEIDLSSDLGSCLIELLFPPSKKDKEASSENTY